MSDTLDFWVNGQAVHACGEQVNWNLLCFLREELRLTGTKQGCDLEGACGACTVIVNGKARRACQQKVSALQQAHITTIESLQMQPGHPPHPLIQTVVQDGIFQCGYCAPGALLSARALLDENPNPTCKDIERVLSGVLCRCAALNRMDRSVLRAAAIIRGDTASTWRSEDSANEESFIARLTGKTRFTADYHFENMLYARVVRAGVPHARVLAVDTHVAAEIPGVREVLTARDVPGTNAFGAIRADQPVFCDENHPVNHPGDALAVVVADTPEAAETGAKAVQVHLESLPVIEHTDIACRVDTPPIHPALNLAKNEDHPNVLKHFQARKGTLSQGFAAADVIVEGDYSVPFVEHAYMEVECSIAVPEVDGSITIYCGSQGPVEDQHQIAAALELPLEKVRVAHQFMGGGFGGKEDIAGQIHAALAARVTGKPVMLKWSRAESLLTSTKRHAMKMHYRSGATKSGQLTAVEAEIIGDTGPYASVGEAVLFRACVFSCGPYVVPHASVDSYAVHTHNAIGGAFRGYGSPQVAFAAEIQMQKLADALGMDAIEFRLQNALEVGQATLMGDILTPEVGDGIKACLLALRHELESTPYPQVGNNEKLGIGVATAYKNVGFGSNLPDSAGAVVSLEADGMFLIRHGATDMGQGINQAVAIIGAEALGIPLAYIRVHTADTRLDPPGGMTTASRQTFVTGNAVLQAAQGLRSTLLQKAAHHVGCSEQELTLSAEGIIRKDHQMPPLPYSEFFGMEQRVTYHAPETCPPSKWSPSYPQTGGDPVHFAYDFGAQAAMVAVNIESGAVRVLKIIAAHDTGKVISRRNVIGQIEGAVVQGIGYALSESFPMQGGMPLYTRLRDLGLLRFRDLPEIVPLIVENAHPYGPFGAKGMGELTIAPTAPAIINAIHDAVGVWVTDLPVTPEKVLRKLHENA